jgi:hypothetical protein
MQPVSSVRKLHHLITESGDKGIRLRVRQGEKTEEIHVKP